MCIFVVFFIMIRRTPYSTSTDTLHPYTTHFRSKSNCQMIYTGPSVSIDRGFRLASGNSYLNVNAGTTLEFEGQVTGGGTLRKRGDGVLLQSDRKSTRLNSSHSCASRMPSSA